MDRIIQPTAGSPAPAWPATPPGHPPPSGQPFGHGPAPAAPSAKGAGDYFRALRRRAFLVLAVAVTVGVAGAAYIVRQPNVYRGTAQLKIEPPQGDPAVAIIVAQSGIGQYNDRSIETYIPNRIALLRGSKSLAERATNHPSVRDLVEPGGGDPAADLLANLTTRPLLPATNAFEVQLEGKNPERVTKLLNALLELFKAEAREDNLHKINTSTHYAETSLAKMGDELKRIDGDIKDLLTGSALLAPGGINLREKQFVGLTALLDQKRNRLDQLDFDARLGKFSPLAREAGPSPMEQKVADLKKEKKYYTKRMDKAKSIVRDYRRDPAYRYLADQVKEIDEELDAYTARLPKARGPLPDLAAIALNHAEADIRNLDRQLDDSLQQLKGSMSEHQTYMTLLQDREQKSREISSIRDRLSSFRMLAETQKPPIIVESDAVEPTSPVRPKRAMMIVIFGVLGVILGVGLVCLLEFLDHSVKVPEQLTAGLTLPLLGVIPRMRRLAGCHRGGHLWTSGAPYSVEADAYRNLRASLLGLSGPRGPIVTLLVTSAKAGEGKSTTALNLAATCARSGERTLLVDVDLRRPSLGTVFCAEGYHAGLVEILRGELPWQRAVEHTDLPNLDFLPTGDPTGVPIEILGTLELRQLLSALSGHYDRVILDGPAILGLADCRMLGRMVDAALLVVRSGAHELRPLQRAKAMLTQSQVAIAGIAFNGVGEDYGNWSSYGVDAPQTFNRGGTAPRKLDSRPDEPAALAAGSPGL